MDDFRISKDNNNTEDMLYTFASQEDHMDSDNNYIIDYSNRHKKSKFICAKISRNNYYIRYSAPHIYNPYDQIHQQTGDLYRDTITFKKVDMTTFRMYLDFLKTKNYSKLHNVQRKAIA